LAGNWAPASTTLTLSLGPAREPVEAHPENLPGAAFRAWLRGLGTTEAKPFVEVSRSSTGVVGAERNRFYRAGRFYPLTESFGQEGFTLLTDSLFEDGREV
jgi:hypothetical protein